MATYYSFCQLGRYQIKPNYINILSLLDEGSLFINFDDSVRLRLTRGIVK